jgi:hypothetical protein
VRSTLAPDISRRLQTQKHRAVWSIVLRNEVVALGRANVSECLSTLFDLQALSPPGKNPGASPNLMPDPTQLDGART